MKNNLEILKICLEETGNAKDRLHESRTSKDPDKELAEGLCSLLRIESELKIAIEEAEKNQWVVDALCESKPGDVLVLDQDGYRSMRANEVKN